MSYREQDTDQLLSFMRANSFGTLVSVLDGAPFATHLPFVITWKEGRVILTGHIAKANPQGRAFGAGKSLAIFSGPHAYVSPTLYESKESVPTWNYIAVHAYGAPRTLTLSDSREALEKTIVAMIDVYDPGYRARYADLSDAYRDKMLNGIIGFEIQVTRLEGKYKLSQNRGTTDQDRVARYLAQSDNPITAEVGRAMLKNLSRKPSSAE